MCTVASPALRKRVYTACQNSGRECTLIHFWITVERTPSSLLVHLGFVVNLFYNEESPKVKLKYTSTVLELWLVLIKF